MITALILIGAVPATLLIISKLALATPPAHQVLVEIPSNVSARISREDLPLAA